MSIAKGFLLEKNPKNLFQRYAKERFLSANFYNAIILSANLIFHSIVREIY